MDPASATVAFVGFAASLASIAGIVVDSCKTLHNICVCLKDAPSDIQRLQKKVKRLEGVVLTMKNAGNNFHDESLRSHLEQYLSTHATEMEEDLNMLKAKIHVLYASLQKKTRSNMHSLARIRKFFSEEEIAKYEQIVSSHMESFNFMLTLLNSAQTKSILAEVRDHSRQLDSLVSSTKPFDASLQWRLEEAHHFICTNASSICQGVAQNLKGITNDAFESDGYTLGLMQGKAITADSLRIEPIPPQTSSLTWKSEQTSSPASPTQAFEAERNALDLDRHLIGGGDPHTEFGKQRDTDLAPKILCKLSIYQLPVGVLIVQSKKRNEVSDIKNKRNRDLPFTVKIAFFPPSWIAKRMVQLSFQLGTSSDGEFSMRWTLKQARYNESPMLLRFLRSGDLYGLRRMIAQGSAKATDIIAPWGNSLLHEAVFSYAAGNPNCLNICEFLLDEGADPNARSNTGRTALFLCSRLMNETHHIELQEIASLLIRRGSDLALCDDTGRSVCSEIFMAQHGLRYLESFVYRYIDLFTLQQMASADAWLLAGLARSFPAFQTCLESQLREYRTPSSISSCRIPQEQYIMELDTEHQLAEIKKASPTVRTGFLRALFAKGTLPMITPFLQAGIDLDESDNGSNLSYVRAAARTGNISVLSALLQAGASMNMKTARQSRNVLSPVDDILERWYSLRIGRPEYFGRPESEYWILKELLQNPTFYGPNVIYLALHKPQPPFIFKCLLDAGCGRRDGIPPASWEHKKFGSEVIEAVKADNPILLRFLDYGLAIECEDRLGFTALLHALDRGKGSINFTKVLIEAGADLCRRTASGYTPLEFATQNLQAKHPRPLRGRAEKTWTLRSVTEEEDRESLELLKSAIRERRQARTTLWLGVNPLKRISFTLRTLAESALGSRIEQNYLRKRSFSDSLLLFLGLLLTFIVFLQIVYQASGPSK